MMSNLMDSVNGNTVIRVAHLSQDKRTEDKENMTNDSDNSPGRGGRVPKVPDLNVQNNNISSCDHIMDSETQCNELNSSGSTLRNNSFSKSNPQLNSTSFVEVHPLSNSFMDSNVRKSLTTSLRVSPAEPNARTRAPNAHLTSPPANQQSRLEPQENHSANSRRIDNRTIPAQIPIIGYEVMEERARFTIYKLRIDDPRTGLSWMVFRRYTDFVRLYQKLKIEYRNLILPLPEKRLFRNNFDPAFLDERARGLQMFVNAVAKKLSADRNVREFFCLDEPPPVGDSEPEAQALFGALEDTVGALKNQIRQQEDALKYMRQKVFYLEEKMKSCAVCNPLGCKAAQSDSPDSSGSSNGS